MINLKEKYRIYFWASLTALAIFIFYICLQTILSGEEGRIKKFILQGRRAVERKDLLTCANMLSTNYHDKYGNDRSSVIYTTKQIFAYYKNILIYIEKMEIKLNNSKNQNQVYADVDITAVVLGQIGQNKQEYILEKGKGRFRVRLTKENGKWQVLEVEFFDPVTIIGHEIS